MYPTICVGCDKRFLASSRRHKRCDACKKGLSHHAQKRPTQFIGVDGEGVNRPDEKHEYVLLSVGNRSLYRDDGGVLTFYEIIPFLWECFLRNPSATYVGFYLGYDFTMWLRHLPENRARMLLDKEGIRLRRRTKSGDNRLPFPVEHRGWNFDVLPMKRFRLWEDGSNLRMYICDTGPYFQTSFLKTVDPEQWPDGPILSDTEFKLIKAGKAERGNDIVEYGTPISEEMIEYNILENDVLSRLMTRYNTGLLDVDIKLKRDQWFGPGQAAQTWMRNVQAPTREQFENRTSLDIRSKLRFSYYGGWFEIFAHGHIVGDSYSYDINSAYPDIQSRLPCCLHGKWIESSSSSLPIGESDYIVVRALLMGSSNHCGSGQHRLRTGHILRPQKTEGWYWWHEIQAGIRAGVIDNVEIREWIAYFPCDCSPPFEDERQLYKDRIRVGKNTISGKARRLVYNSAYGKTAQSIGVAKYANPFYASAITSHCRTRILDAIANHPKGIDDVLMVATDGIVFRHPHTNLHLHATELGSWSETTHRNLCLFMPGIYWDDRTREKLYLGEHPSLKSRGIPARNLATKIFEIDERFKNPFTGDGFPTFELPLNFMLVSPKQALARGKWETCGTVTQYDPNCSHNECNCPVRIINSDPSMKRNPILYERDGILWSTCYPTPFGNLVSHPYSKTFGDEEQEMLRDLITPDGTIDLHLAEGLQ